MRLSVKFTLAFLLCLGAVFSVFSYLRVEREIALFDVDFRKDHEAMGRDLAAAVVRIWDLQGEAPALAFINDTNETKGQVHIRWIHRGESTGGDPTTRLTPVELETVAQRDEVVSDTIKVDGRPVLRTFVPVTNKGDWLGILELTESTSPAREYVRTSVLRTLVITSVIAVLTACLAMLLGIWFVGRPVRLLAGRARRIAAGDFTGRLQLRQADEFADLANEINTMSDRLAEAQQRVAAETAARIEAIEQLRHADRLRTVGQLTSGIAHELGTPLNVVWERAKMIANDRAAPGASAANAKIIAEQSARMTKIIRQLLDFSRPARPRKVRIELRQIIRQTLSLLRPTLERRRVTALFEGADEPVIADLDVEQIEQVASNLLLNAVHAMPGGGTVSVTTGSKRCRPPTADTNEESDFAFFAVSDQGQGITPENLSRVFDPFFTTKDVGEGTGLGLSIALGIVKEHGGWIDVKSPPGEGACFTVYLPKESARCEARS